MSYTASGDYKLPGKAACRFGNIFLDLTTLLPFSVRSRLVNRHEFYQSFENHLAEGQQGISLNKWKVIQSACKFKGKTVLDIGCAEGFFCQQAALAGATHVQGVDSRFGTLLCAKSMALNDQLPISYKLGVFPGNGFVGKFDVILCLSVLHHLVTNKDIWLILTDRKYAEDLQKLRSAMKFLLSLLNPGGHCIIEMPYEYDPSTNRNAVDFDLFIKELEQAGFSQAERIGSWKFNKGHEGKKDRILYVARS